MCIYSENILRVGVYLSWASNQVNTVVCTQNTARPNLLSSPSLSSSSLSPSLSPSLSTSSGEIRSGTVVTYNDKEEILCENCSPDVTLNDTPANDVSSPPPSSSSSHSSRDNRDPSTAQTKPSPPPVAPSTQNTLESNTNSISNPKRNLKSKLYMYTV